MPGDLRLENTGASLLPSDLVMPSLQSRGIQNIMLFQKPKTSVHNSSVVRLEPDAPFLFVSTSGI